MAYFLSPAQNDEDDFIRWTLILMKQVKNRGDIFPVSNTITRHSSWKIIGTGIVYPRDNQLGLTLANFDKRDQKDDKQGIHY